MKKICIILASIFILFINLSSLIYSKETAEEIIENPSRKSKGEENERDSIVIESDEEFDDPSLLSKSSRNENEPRKKKKKEEKQSNSEKKEAEKKEKKEKETETKKEPEIKKEEDTIKMNKYKHFAMTHIYEMIMISIMIIFVINAIKGYETNKEIATNWLKGSLKFFEDNYAHLGEGKEYNPSNVSLIKDSYNNYKFYASGRVNISWMLVDIYLRKRQDLVSVFSRFFLFNEKDKVTYQSSVVPSDDIPCIFAVCKKGQAKTNKKNYPELNDFTHSYTPKYINENLVVLTEDDEIIDKLFSNKKFSEQYKLVEKYIDFIYFTDRRTTKEKHLFAITYELKDDTDNNIYNEMTIFAHMFIDLLCTLNIKPGYKKDAINRRKEFEARRNKEIAEKNKEEMKTAKDEKKMAEQNKPMTREQMQKQEEKERKEHLKERRKRLYKVVKA